MQETEKVEEIGEVQEPTEIVELEEESKFSRRGCSYRRYFGRSRRRISRCR